MFQAIAVIGFTAARVMHASMKQVWLLGRMVSRIAMNDFSEECLQMYSE